MEIKVSTENNGFKTWFGESVILKLALIGFLILILLIPSAWIQDLITERQQRLTEVNDDVSDKWAKSQLVQGPVLVIPYKTTSSVKDSTGRSIVKDHITNINILPELLNIKGSTNPKILHRGIFDAVVYNSVIDVSGRFSPLELKKSGINPQNILWAKTKVVIGLSDLKGLKNNPSVKIGDTVFQVEPDFGELSLFDNNLIAQPDLSKAQNTSIPFSFRLDLRGSNDLSFMHLGKSTTVHVNGIWNDPSFTGRYLPDNRKIDGKNFSATWQMPYFNRPFPQQWIEQSATLKTKNDEGTFGVKFLLPVDQYQKTMRSAKYAILIILLTFISLFFTELLFKRKVHLLQYVLIGAAMTIYYTLLLSLSEKFGFNTAYFIASVSTIMLVASFIATVLNSKKPALIFGGILSIFYGFIFVIIQLQDLALLFGSIGLFLIIAVMMYLSAKIDWSVPTSQKPSTNPIL